MAFKKSLTNLILLAMEKSVDGYLAFEDFAYNPLLVGRDLKKSQLSVALKRLRENGLIELVSDEKLVARLTDSGKDKVLWEKIKSDDEKWDGKWRIVIWDIPEKRRKARDLLRYKLKWLGFKQLQKSIWVTKKDCTEMLRDYINKLGIKEWVRVIEAENVDF
ncbi:hypothetical protein A3C59_01780 [Candidatus Daviesbacteria bacterium RIFCSPHIGHO2_02_FULL_36_13]|uniref:Transcriptional repressor PaaX-like central Cas2-like domain-containing protein n=1 Tax=Candidatus Daviesbacteria bacterium RIFCSPHIGHO2_02_FULL_36_13 TaxID=1797768 RepID=A0A1F5JWE6_9BACT|nr:MAG: hypothetical protein A3C59_01780 [Candidatus Daviesbacteria bacterium RIFCSPHIGHO2_02_FULL_36_13]OGE41029.1 MAG: hypothetical protein A3A45_03950 [Candidatus Daviesbacteria bacterium RIFCSPLOWO2_01_FULL_36_8]